MVNYNLNFSNNVALCLISIFVLYGCGDQKSPEKENSKVPVKTMMVQSRQVVFPIHCTGTLSKKSEMKLSFKTGGLISKIHADEGELVHKGDMMATLNLSEIKAHASQATQALNKAQRDYVRVKNLFRDSVATLEQLQNTQTALQVASSNDHIAQFNLKYSVIRAPADGRVLKRLAEPNEMIAPGHPVFLFSNTDNEWVVRCNLSDLDRVKVHYFDSARILFDAYPLHTFQAILTEMGDWADPFTGTYEIELTVRADTLDLVSGFIGKVSIFPDLKKYRVMIPAGALVMGKGEKGFVYKVVNGKPVMQGITFSSIQGDSLAVLQGLHSGDKIITEGSYYVDNSSEILIYKQSGK